VENSILKSTKKMLGLADSYTAFDHDVIVHLNSVFGDLNQIGIGPVDGFMIEDDEAEWDDYVTPDVPTLLLSSVRSYVFLRVKNLFDPPQPGYLREAAQHQIEQSEWRLNVVREGILHPLSDYVEEEV
jgi:hypothetical protein